MNEISGVGIGWYSEENYATMRSILGNPDNMPIAYRDWLILFEEGKKEIRRRRLIPVEVKVNPHAFSDWCHLHELEVNRNNLSVFISIEGRRISSEGGLINFHDL